MRARPGRVTRALPSLYSLAVSVLILGPLFGPGYLLLRDAVSTPRSHLTDSALGLSDAAARAVPQDALLAAVSSVVDGGLAVKAILLLALWLAGWGAARLVRVLLPAAGLGPQLVASTVMLWNPYVAERLLQGHWSLLVGYAALPWTVCAAVAIRRGARGGWCRLAVCMAAAGLTPTGALLAIGTALAVLAAPGGWVRRVPRLAGALALFAVASAPWLTATALSGGVDGSDPAGVPAFAARAEPGLGTLGSLAGLGGIWNADAVPGSRTGVYALAGTVLLLVVIGCGVPALWRRRRNPVVRALAALGAVGVLGPALAATAWGLAIGEWTVVHVPGAGLLRDAQKWVALAAPLYTLAAAAGVGYLRDRVGFPPARGGNPTRSVVWAAATILAVLIALPDLGWGVGGRLRSVTYPSSWQRVAAQLESSTEDGDVAVLPAGMFRRFPYSGDAPVLDPAPRMLPRNVLQTGELVVAGGSVAGEGTRATQVEQVLLAGGSPEQLAALGARWVLVERSTPGPLGESGKTLARLTQEFTDGELTLYRVEGGSVEGGSVTAYAASTGARGATIAAHLLWAGLLAGGLACALRGVLRGGRRIGIGTGRSPRRPDRH